MIRFAVANFDEKEKCWWGAQLHDEQDKAIDEALNRAGTQKKTVYVLRCESVVEVEYVAPRVKTL